MKKSNGITLLALVITLIVLIILAGISVYLMIGDNGVLTKAATVELEYSKTEVEEQFEMLVNDKIMEAYSQVQNDKSDISGHYKESILIPKFIEEGYITPDTTSSTVQDVLGEMVETKLYSIYIINVSKLSDKIDLYGKGENISTGDVFTLEVKTDETGKSTGEYELKYYEQPNSEGEVLTTFSLYLSNNL